MPLTTRNSNKKKQVNRNRKTKSAAPKKKASKPKPTPPEIHPVKLAAGRLRVSHEMAQSTKTTAKHSNKCK